MTFPNGERHLRLRGFFFGLIPIILMGAVLFIGAGTFAWLAAWAILGVLLVTTAIISFTCSTDLIQERTLEQEGVKEYDRKMLWLLNLVGFLTLFIAGLDLRFGWTGQISFSLQVVGFILFLLGYCLFSWAMLSNRFFSRIVRIQDEKGHNPVTTGPYRFVRHPSYLGFIVIVLVQPIVLGSLLALIPALVTAAVIVWRTSLEDRTLVLELKGYEAYARQVRYRLVPGVW
ncbi:methyltransferase family protein [Methanosphaerula palustris]|uniref:Isoprenylcysteine carboxyl methyltransferase n=1 Tax=Methanosphaerula palustris (strain ATCC BAA-1556 / DSM 19958 / E1-9c) TaxID=521011 RepID=B8GJ07_METPE|nr:isoprenylcysteine carboxylmethyltransferase family protein [Methanosphaerula palustris]ACL15580.1 Isoprenylcysteine carboxyl methyltransferase [Methanosphaerula palustris E1-9c]